MRPQRTAPHGARRRTRPAGESQAVQPARALTGEGLTRADHEREALMRIAAGAAAASSLEDVIELTADAASEAMGPGSLSISRWEPAEEAMRTLINVGDLAPGEERFPESELYPLDDHPALAKLVRNAVPYFTAIDDPDAGRAAVEVLRALGKESDIGLPILVGGEVWGEVWASTAPGTPRFRATDVRFLENVAGQLAAVISRVELFSNVSRLAYEDELTGLANRRALEERLELAVARYAEDGGSLTLLICDVDGLKTINDTRGHQAGDRALRRAGEALVAAAGTVSGALVGRLSGDEFAVVLEGATLEDARQVAGTALQLLREARDVPVTMSCGAAAAAAGMARRDQLLRAADTAQYAAKRRGGAQFCTAGASAVPRSPAPRRRSNRRGVGERLEQTVRQLLDQLDAELADHGTLDRLETVVTGFAEALNAAAWTISFAEHGGQTISSISAAEDCDGRLRGMRVGLDDEVYQLSDYPLTEAIAATGSGSFVVDRHDRGADPAERTLLGELGFSAVLGAAAPDLDGVYLVELYADGDTADFALAELRLQLLARAATTRSAGTAHRMGQLQKRTQQLAATGALGARLAGMVDAGEIVEAAVDELYREFGFPVCGIVRLTADNRVEIAAGRGELISPLRERGWSQPAGLGLLGRALREREVVIVGDVQAEPDYRPTDTTGEMHSELCAPLWAGSSLWGVIDVQDACIDAFDEADASFVRTVADQVSSALRSASLYDKLERAYLDTAQALGSALEAKDSYTAGHSQSIAANAQAVGRALGVDEAGLRALRFGAALHDIGKLAIPETILNKGGPLTPQEWVQVQQHTVIGEQILAPIDFLRDVRPLVRHGHERWDGEGYPDRLCAEEIPLGARIIFACDAYDAMTTDRSYRAALAPAEAIAELARCAGTQFDPRVVDALLGVLGAEPPGQVAVAS